MRSSLPLRLPFAIVLGLPGYAGAQQSPPEPLVIDHVIVGTADLDRGIEELRRLTGVTAQFGGMHPGRGTQNALVSLGPDAYLELVAPSGEADPTGTAAYLASLDRLTPGGWALTSSDLVATIRDLESAGFTFRGPIRGSRKRSDGSVLEWATAHAVGDATGLFPFLIQWGHNAAHPARTSPAGCRLTAVHLQAIEPDALRRFLALVQVIATVEQAPKSAMRLTLSCPAGTVVLGQ